MGKTADESGLDKAIVELAKLRVSQINNCAFCLQIHLNVSRRLGVPQEKLDLVATWHEAGIFSEQGMRGAGLGRGADATSPTAACPDEAYDAVRRHFSEERGDLPQRGDRHHQCLEPAGRGLPLRAADPEAGDG